MKAKGIRMDRMIEAAREAALTAGELVRNKFGERGRIDVEEKAKNDYVTAIDRASEEIIVSALSKSFPGIPVLAEEGGGGIGGLFWVVDPLDGTTNFIHGYPQVGVSIALIEDGGAVAGVTYDPLRDELFEALKGKGAYCNGSPVSVSSPGSLGTSLLGTGFPFRVHQYLDPYLETFRSLLTACRGIRRAGAAVLDLAHVASGRLDGFWELYLKPWDMAAGGLMIMEAGGKVSDFFGKGGFLSSGNIVAGSSAVHGEILKRTMDIFTEEQLAPLSGGFQ
jgi:myo-inositol-1(or 4)-monophosphatase